jgi:hypothetical protein
VIPGDPRRVRDFVYVDDVVVAATGVAIETPGGELPPGEGEGYAADGDLARLGLSVRPIEDAVVTYVEWLRRHPAAQGRA